MNQTHNPKLTDLSKKLRKSMTKEERHLWYDFLKELPITVNRQKVIGNYIVDFYIASSKIAIELDGSQHYESAGEVRDFKRDLWLHDNGIKVLRYSNAEVKQNFEGVCRDILLHITTSSTASGPPSPQGEANKSGGEIHTTAEWAWVDSLKQSAQWLAAFICEET